MFKKILLPLDLTDKHQAAIDVAAELAGQTGGELTLLHVVELIHGLPMEEEKEFYGRLERLARAHMDRFSSALTRRRIAFRAEVVFGVRAQEIVRHAGASSADLIVLTAPRIGPENPVAGLGSMSYRVGMLAPCPVLLVK
jgi:nucleotide-binding universal stress UspA family protein